MISGATRPIFETYVTKWLDDLPAYDTTVDTSAELDLFREMWDSNAYYCMMVPFPNDIVGTGTGSGANNILNFLPGDTKTDSINIPVGSYLVSISGLSANNTLGAQATPAGFKFRLYDKGAQTDLFYGTYAIAQTASGDGGALGTSYPPINPISPYLLQSPLIVLPPGLLQIEITNLDINNAATIQMMFQFACPTTNQALNNVAQSATK